MMKILHEKYKIVGSKKNVSPCIAEFKNSFNNAVERNKELGNLVDKTQQLLSPAKVTQLFLNVCDEVCKCINLTYYILPTIYIHIITFPIIYSLEIVLKLRK